MATINGYSQEVSYLLYKLWNKGYVGDHQVKEEFMYRMLRSTSAAAHNASQEDVDKYIEQLHQDNVLNKYQSGREAWSLNASFVAQHTDELEEMQAEQSGVNRIL